MISMVKIKYSSNETFGSLKKISPNISNEENSNK